MFFFFNDTATTEIYTLSLHDALPIFDRPAVAVADRHLGLAVGAQVGHDLGLAHVRQAVGELVGERDRERHQLRSEEHTSELQSRQYLVCRLLLEKKKIKHNYDWTQNS